MTVVAIDGPAGSGKSTVAAAVAARTGLPCLHTGAMYRAATLAALRAGVDVHDPAALGALVAGLHIEVGERVLLDGEDVTEAVGSGGVTAAVSQVSVHAPVRRALVDLQRAWVEEHGGGVVEGRDIGSVVFPGADVKVYLTASVEVRARRRLGDGVADGDGAAHVDDVSRRIEERDRRDAGRAEAPLVVASDAHVIDSSMLDVGTVVDKVVALL